MTKQEVKDIARKYGVNRVYFYNDTTQGSGGGFHRLRKVRGTPSESIHLNLDDKEGWRSTIFHELGHSYCTREGIFPYYHRLKGGSWIGQRYIMKRQGLRGLLRTAWRAECFVDRWARKEMKKHYPRHRYSPGYDGKPGSKTWLDCYYLSRFRDYLSYLNKKAKNRN